MPQRTSKGQTRIQQVEHDHGTGPYRGLESGATEAVAAVYTEDSSIISNQGEPWDGRAQVAELASHAEDDARQIGPT